MKPSPFEVVKRARAITPAVIVGVSGGKDSLATLDVCARHFDRIEAFFMYVVEGLEFQEKYLAYLERRYHIQIQRLPHFVLSGVYKDGYYRPITTQSAKIGRITLADIEFKIRQLTGLEWIATGQKKIDSLERTAMLSHCNSIDVARKRMYPIADWNNAAVFNYLKRNNVPLPPDYAIGGASFGGRLNAEWLRGIRERFPKDYQKILEVFPHAEAIVWRERFQRERATESHA